VSVVLEEVVIGVTVSTHGGETVAVALLDVGVTVVAAGELDGLLGAGVAALLVPDVAATVEDAGAAGVAHAEVALVPLRPVVAVLSSGMLVIAEAPVEGLRPAPPAVTLWWWLGLAGIAGGAPTVASTGAVETVASTALAMAWIPVT
jgi:hypothetical protein